MHGILKKIKLNTEHKALILPCCKTCSITSRSTSGGAINSIDRERQCQMRRERKKNANKLWGVIRKQKCYVILQWNGHHFWNICSLHSAFYESHISHSPSLGHSKRQFSTIIHVHLMNFYSMNKNFLCFSLEIYNVQCIKDGTRIRTQRHIGREKKIENNRQTSSKTVGRLNSIHSVGVQF